MRENLVDVTDQHGQQFVLEGSQMHIVTGGSHGAIDQIHFCFTKLNNRCLAIGRNFTFQ